MPTQRRGTAPLLRDVKTLMKKLPSDATTGASSRRQSLPIMVRKNRKTSVKQGDAEKKILKCSPPTLPKQLTQLQQPIKRRQSKATAAKPQRRPTVTASSNNARKSKVSIIVKNREDEISQTCDLLHGGSCENNLNVFEEKQSVIDTDCAPENGLDCYSIQHQVSIATESDDSIDSDSETDIYPQKKNMDRSPMTPKCMESSNSFIDDDLKRLDKINIPADEDPLKQLTFPAIESGRVASPPPSSLHKNIAELEAEIEDIEEMFTRVQEAISRKNIRNRILVYAGAKS